MLALALAMLIGGTPTLAVAYPLTPNLQFTRGDLCSERNPDFVGYRYEEKIPFCQRNVPQALKKQIYDLYQIPTKCRHLFTIDHLIPPSIGGSNEPINLWPEHHDLKKTRFYLEQEVFEKLRDGILNQQEAIDMIFKDKFNPYSMGLEEMDCHQPT
mgnify:CR=1 FL=1